MRQHRLFKEALSRGALPGAITESATSPQRHRASQATSRVRPPPRSGFVQLYSILTGIVDSDQVSLASFVLHDARERLAKTHAGRAPILHLQVCIALKRLRGATGYGARRT